MLLEVRQQDLAKSLNLVSRFTSQKAQLPILQNIHLKTEKNKLIIQATNLESSISAQIGAKLKTEGQVAVPAKIFTDLVANLNQGNVLLESKSEFLSIKADNFSSKLAGVNAADFPQVPEMLGKKSFQLETKPLLKATTQAMISVSHDDTRPTLTGVLFVFGDSMSLVATDGFRLSKTDIDSSISGDLKNLMLPRSILSEISRLNIEEETIMLEYNVNDNQVIFGIGQTILSSRVIDGQFPDYQRIIPKSIQTKVSLSKKDFAQAIKLSSVFARDSAFTISLKVEKNSLIVISENTQTGQQESSVDAKIEGPNLQISFNYKFIEDFLGTVDGEEVVLELTDSSSPGVFKDSTEPNYLHLIMPVRS